MSRLIQRWMLPFFDPRAAFRLAALPGYIAELRSIRRSEAVFPVRFRDTHPCLSDRTTVTPFDPHYFYQSAWLARRLTMVRPTAHVDIGSSVVMIGVISAMVPTTFVDIRPLVQDLPDLKCLEGSITAVPFPARSQASLSCLHVIEHIGLGRYGDAIDPDGYKKGLAELRRVLAPNGRLYLSTPVGRQRVCFNAHRVFAPDTILAEMPELKLLSFSLVDDDRRFHADCPPSCAQGLDYGCGFFELTREA
jgi:hypothetical protein